MRWETPSMMLDRMFAQQEAYIAELEAKVAQLEAQLAASERQGRQDAMHLAGRTLQLALHGAFTRMDKIPAGCGYEGAVEGPQEDA